MADSLLRHAAIVDVVVEQENICSRLHGSYNNTQKADGRNSNSFSDIITQPTSHKNTHTHALMLPYMYVSFRFVVGAAGSACRVRFLSALCALFCPSPSPTRSPSADCLPVWLWYYQVKCFCGFCRCFVYHINSTAASRLPLSTACVASCWCIRVCVCVFVCVRFGFVIITITTCCFCI